jgi:hypothetical protein
MAIFMKLVSKNNQPTTNSNIFSNLEYSGTECHSVEPTYVPEKQENYKLPSLPSFKELFLSSRKLFW